MRGGVRDRDRRKKPIEEIVGGLSPLTDPFTQSAFTECFLGARRRPWAAKGKRHQALGAQHLRRFVRSGIRGLREVYRRRGHFPLSLRRGQTPSG